MKSEIEKTEYFKLGKMTILCLITLRNGYEVIGTATKPMENLDQEEEARGIAYQRALYKLVELEAFPQLTAPTVATAPTAGWVPTITF